MADFGVPQINIFRRSSIGGEDRLVQSSKRPKMAADVSFFCNALQVP
jgi:hypothetical protein